jgi:hypothetical protein
VYEFHFKQEQLEPDTPKGIYRFTPSLLAFAEPVGNVLNWMHGDAKPKDKIKEFYKDLGEQVGEPKRTLVTIKQPNLREK